MTLTVTDQQAEADFDVLLDLIARGETVEILRRGRPVALLVPIQDGETQRDDSTAP